MKLKQEIDCRCSVRASLTEDGELSVRVIATTVYDETSGATTSAYFEVTGEMAAGIRVALEAAMRSCEPQIARKITDAIHVSREAAKREGEIE